MHQMRCGRPQVKLYATQTWQEKLDNNSSVADAHEVTSKSNAKAPDNSTIARDWDADTSMFTTGTPGSRGRVSTSSANSPSLDESFGDVSMPFAFESASCIQDFGRWKFWQTADPVLMADERQRHQRVVKQRAELKLAHDLKAQMRAEKKKSLRQKHKKGFDLSHSSDEALAHSLDQVSLLDEED
uniref:Uncharacterized protein n=1 Tax=Plectus sambesii TaxID=2011161 RepID=A0A914VLP6_9BILA